VSGRHGAVRHHFQGLAVFALGLVLTSASLSVAHAVIASAGRLTEAGVLTAANLATTGLRFVLFRGWIFRGW